jgi:3-hydroxyisobutyrate dehydrogenase
MRLGFVGLGSQGAPMARRMIDAGYPVTLWARRAEALAPFAETSAAIASSIAELGAQADHVGICVVDDAGVREVCAPLFPALRPGSRIAIHSTVHPVTCIELAQAAAERSLALIDAPVSGGAPAASAGTLTVMVGGDADAVAQARPVFETFGKLVLHLGGVGAGQNAKLVNNALMTAHMALAHHALAASAALGVDRAAFVDLVKASSGRSFGFETYARLPNPAAFSHGAALLAKDLRLLGEVLKDDASFVGLRDIGGPFLELALAKKAS